MRISIEGIDGKDLFLLMEGFIKPSGIKFDNREELLAKWDEYKDQTIERGKKAGII